MASRRTLADLASTSDASDPEDGDYVPAAPKTKGKSKTSRKRDRAGSASSSGSSAADSSLETEEPEAKRGKVVTGPSETDEEKQERRRKEDEKWKALLEGTEEGAESSGAGPAAAVDEELVEVQRPRKFAGEVIYETVRLPASHPDVKKYSKPSEGTETEDAAPLTANAAQDPAAVDAPTAASTAPAPAPSPAAPQPPLRKGPPPRRKPRQSLEAMNAALANGQGKKMTTLEKSQLDWKSHTSALDASTAAELEANRRQGGGGYLEKREFLDRVGERVEQSMDGAARGRRR